MPIVLIGAAALMIYCGIEGARHGVVRRAIEVVGLLLIFLFASELAHALEPWLSDTFDITSRVAFFGSWAVVLVGGVIGVRLLANGAGKLVRFSIVGWLDRGGGFVLGVGFGALLVSCLLIGLLAIPIGDDLEHDLVENPITSALLVLAPAVYDTASDLWRGGTFRELVEEHVEPTARGAVEGLRAFLDSLGRDEGEGASQ